MGRLLRHLFSLIIFVGTSSNTQILFKLIMSQIMSYLRQEFNKRWVGCGGHQLHFRDTTCGNICNLYFCAPNHRLSNNGDRSGSSSHLGRSAILNFLTDDMISRL